MGAVAWIGVCRITHSTDAIDRRSASMFWRRWRDPSDTRFATQDPVVFGLGLLLIALAFGLSSLSALALPLYARKTGEPCATCHTAFLELTPFGRRFKLGGYELRGGDWEVAAVCDHAAAGLHAHASAASRGSGTGLRRQQ
jgi:hypothetical protein